MRHPWTLWLAFAICLVVALAAMGWVSLTALRLEQAEAEGRRQAAVEENVFLALWRMDSALVPILARESAQPVHAYQTLRSIPRPQGGLSQLGPGGQWWYPSPLLPDVWSLVLVHFQIDPDGRIGSPRVPADAMHGLAVPRYLSEKAVQEARRHVARVAAIVDRKQLLAMLPEPEPVFPGPGFGVPPLLVGSRAMQGLGRPEGAARGRGAEEFDQRNRAVLQNTANAIQVQNEYLDLPDFSPSSPEAMAVLMKPLWVGGELLLARRVVFGGKEYVQGCLLDWPGVKTWLLEMITDLLPDADLEPLARGTDEPEARMLAALPARLLAGTVAPDGDDFGSLVRLPLLIAWGCFLAAAASVATLLGGVIRLSERRAAFVSAVTHELRTPLTTFHIYTEMLGEGMVTDPGQQKHYLNTLRAEAARLSHLVENVLAYARLERGRIDGHVEALPVGRIVDACRGRLADRAAQAGMELVVEGDPAAMEAGVRANPSAAEQILFNLVDNACKYAAAAEDKRIHLAVESSDESVRLRVRDHGPGIAPAVRGRPFRPFSKSAREAAHSAPGVGLGLALSRRLAQDMGGQLRLDESARDGACFVLILAMAR